MRSICAPCESHRQKLQITFVVHSEWSVCHVLLNVTEKDADTCKCELRRSGGISYFKAKLTRILPMQKSAEGIQAFLTVTLPSAFFSILKAASFLFLFWISTTSPTKDSTMNWSICRNCFDRETCL